MKAGIYKNISNENYHGGEGISSSELKSVLANPQKYQWRKNNPEPPTAAMNLGSLFHSMFLEPHKTADEFALVDASTRNTRAFKQAVLEHAGRTVMLSSEFDLAADMAHAAMQSKWVIELMGGDTTIEHSLYWNADSLLHKARPDLWRRDIKVMVDLKSASDGSPEAFRRSVGNFGYDLSAAHYMAGAQALGETVDTFVWIVVESKPPHTVQLYIASEPFIHRGFVRRKKALTKLKQCLETNIWPGYSSEPIELEMPSWMAED